MKKAWVLLSVERTAKILIRLGGCPGWSESSLGAQSFLLVLSWGAQIKTTWPCIIWARSCENVSYVICEQQRCRSACADAQSDQHLCCSLLEYDKYTCYIQSSRILASFCSCAGWFESYLVKNLQRHIFAWCGSFFFFFFFFFFKFWGTDSHEGATSVDDKHSLVAEVDKKNWSV